VPWEILCVVLDRFDDIVRGDRGYARCVRGAWNGSQLLGESGEGLSNGSGALRVLGFSLTHSTARSESV